MDIFAQFIWLFPRIEPWGRCSFSGRTFNTACHTFSDVLVLRFTVLLSRVGFTSCISLELGSFGALALFDGK